MCVVGTGAARSYESGASLPSMPPTLMREDSDGALQSPSTGSSYGAALASLATHGISTDAIFTILPGEGAEEVALNVRKFADEVRLLGYGDCVFVNHVYPSEVVATSLLPDKAATLFEFCVLLLLR